MRRDDEGSYSRSPARMVNHQTDRTRRQTGQRGTIVALTALVVIAAFAGVLLALMQAPSRPAVHTLPPTATLGPRDVTWNDVGLNADEQIVFSHSAPQTAYSCGIANKSIVMHVTHNGGTSWQPLTFASPIASESCALAVDDTNPQQLAIMALVTKPDPCLTTPCTPTPCASACQPCIDYCPPTPSANVDPLPVGGRRRHVAEHRPVAEWRPLYTGYRLRRRHPICLDKYLADVASGQRGGQSFSAD